MCVCTIVIMYIYVTIELSGVHNIFVEYPTKLAIFVPMNMYMYMYDNQAHSVVEGFCFIRPITQWPAPAHLWLCYCSLPESFIEILATGLYAVTPNIVWFRPYVYMYVPERITFDASSNFLFCGYEIIRSSLLSSVWGSFYRKSARLTCVASEYLSICMLSSQIGTAGQTSHIFLAYIIPWITGALLEHKPWVYCMALAAQTSNNNTML